MTAALRAKAHELGFVMCGITAAAAPGRLREFHQWLDAGFAGQMHYLETRREAYASPTSVLDGCKSIVMLAMPYTTRSERARSEVSENAGRVARYASSPIDYHDLIHHRLKLLKGWISEQLPESNSRGIVDTAPLLERDFAEAAGLGWIGKNTLLLNRSHGSYFFLAALLTDAELSVDSPDDKNYCGSCTACIEACPTQAFPEPYILDATKCISYLTIEHRGDVPAELSLQVGDWIFGCDICQEVCPWNRKASDAAEPAFTDQLPYREADLYELLQLTDEGFRERFRKTPLWRSKRRGVVRNAILASVNKQLHSIRPLLERLVDDPEEMISWAARWGLKQLALPSDKG